MPDPACTGPGPAYITGFWWWFNQEYLHLQGWSKCLPTIGRELNNPNLTIYSATDLIFDKFWN